MLSFFFFSLCGAFFNICKSVSLKFDKTVSLIASSSIISFKRVSDTSVFSNIPAIFNNIT